MRVSHKIDAVVAVSDNSITYKATRQEFQFMFEAGEVRFSTDSLNTLASSDPDGSVWNYNGQENYPSLFSWNYNSQISQASMPLYPLFSDGPMSLTCSNCFFNADASIVVTAAWGPGWTDFRQCTSESAAACECRFRDECGWSVYERGQSAVVFERTADQLPAVYYQRRAGAVDNGRLCTF